MKSPLTDRNYLSSFVLLITAGILLLTIVITDRRDMTSSAVVIAATILFLTGIFLFTFVKKEAVDGTISTLIPVQNQINICRMAADLGVKGNAWFIPKELSGTGSTMQFLPVSTYRDGELKGTTYVSGEAGAGILIPPAGETLKAYLMKRSSMIIPDTVPDLSQLIKEIGEELLEISNGVEVRQAGDGISIHLDNYLLIQGCREIMKESPGCCQIHPCAICSLFGSVLAEGLRQPVMIEQCRPVHTGSSVEILFSPRGSGSSDTRQKSLHGDLLMGEEGSSR